MGCGSSRAMARQSCLSQSGPTLLWEGVRQAFLVGAFGGLGLVRWALDPSSDGRLQQPNQGLATPSHLPYTEVQMHVMPQGCCSLFGLLSEGGRENARKSPPRGTQLIHSSFRRRSTRYSNPTRAVYKIFV